MEEAILLIKQEFSKGLAKHLDLRRVTAPLFVLSGTGINDDLNGTERAVSFPIKGMGNAQAEIVHSLAKWKRVKLGAYGIPPGHGLYTDMNAIRSDEELDNLHSLYVDQWDWERTISPSDRTIGFLKGIVEKVYQVLRDTESVVRESFPALSSPTLPEQITFIHSEDLLRKYPLLPPPERENKAAREHGAVFIIGIGGVLSDGRKHDGRAPDYDDWSSETGESGAGLNGDIIVWNEVLGRAFEVSSMGIRVDKDALLRQLAQENAMGRQELDFHKMLLSEKLPLSIGGGIGQSRLCMLLLQCAHIGEVQSSVWPEEQIVACLANNIILR
jgi:aspartate--ammonia ligase